MTGALLCLASYLLGSFPTGALLARARGIDIRKVGSGNIGATNVGRALGRRWAIVVLLIDAFKGYLPVLVGRALGVSSYLIATAALCAVIGHMFTIFLRGKGGKGVATSFGGALALAPIPALAAGAVYAVLVLAFKISSIGSLSGVAAFPLFLWMLGARDPALFGYAVAVLVLVTVRHHENIRRLINGQEFKA